MRELSFLLRLHAFPPLARFSRTPRKPYLPLEVRYIIRPTGEVFLYVSNAPDNRTSFDDLFLFASERFEINTLIPSAGNIPLLLEFLPSPTGIYSHLTNDYVFLGMLCRRGLACHYLPLYEARYFSPCNYPVPNKKSKIKAEKPLRLHSLWGFILLFSITLSIVLVINVFFQKDISFVLIVSCLLSVMFMWSLDKETS